MGVLFSCKGCDSRLPGCHSQCEKYKREKAEYEERKAIERQKQETKQGLKDQRTAAVGKAMRRKRMWR